MSETVRCPDCGHPNPSGSAECSACHYPLSESLGTTPAAPIPAAAPDIPPGRPIRRRPPRPQTNVALSLWLGAFVITIPYVWFLGRGVGVTGDALATGLLVGTLLAIFLASLGAIISLFAGSNRVSLSLSLFLLLALFAPTQLPTSAEKGWVGELLLRVNPVAAGERYVGKIVVNGHAWGEDVSWLVSPLVAATVFAAVAMLVGARFVRLRGAA